MWCGITASTVFGPYFFESDDGTISTVNGERYRIMIREFLIPRIKRRRALRNTWFQQDGATSHTARETMALLKKTFPNRLISRFGNVSWPPRPPDLTPADFFLWGYGIPYVKSLRDKSIKFAGTQGQHYSSNCSNFA